MLSETTTHNRLKDSVLGIVKTIEDGYKSEGLDYYDGQYEKGEVISGWDYLSDVLDINYILNADRSYKGARILVAFGGPNIWIDTEKQTVEGSWWGDAFTASYRIDLMDINDTLEELFNCQ